MIEIAIENRPMFKVDSREIKRDGPSWTALTLEELRASNKFRSISLIVGLDSFLNLPQWHRWESLLGFANIVVANRPGFELPNDGLLRELLLKREVKDIYELHQNLFGKIFLCEIKELDISSSLIRQLLLSGKTINYLLPEPVIRFIKETKCYPMNN